MLTPPKHPLLDCPANEGSDTSHGAVRRRQRNTADRDEDEPAHLRHGLALDANAWLTTLKVEVSASSGAGSVAQTVAAQAVPVPEDLQTLISALARRVAWGGDRRRGSARIELSDGPLAGATLVVHAQAREVRVELELAPGASAANEWRERIIQRLEERGFIADVQLG